LGKYGKLLHAFEKNEIGLFHSIASSKAFLRQLAPLGKFNHSFSPGKEILQILLSY
jgi:hypothetical protein